MTENMLITKRLKQRCQSWERPSATNKAAISPTRPSQFGDANTHVHCIAISLAECCFNDSPQWESKKVLRSLIVSSPRSFRAFSWRLDVVTGAFRRTNREKYRKLVTTLWWIGCFALSRNESRVVQLVHHDTRPAVRCIVLS